MIRSAQKWVAAAACLYEVGAIATGRAPTLTALSTRYPWLAPGLILALAIHLAAPSRPEPGVRHADA